MSIIYPEGSDDIIEPTPIEQVFVTNTCRIEDVGGGNTCFWFGVREGVHRVVKLKPVIPLSCALIMSMHVTNALTKMVRNHPDLARSVRLIG